MNKINHKWGYCDHCDSVMVFCGNCRNNCCNGSENCICCKGAYEYQNDRSTCPKELLDKEERAYKLMRYSLSDTQEELKKENLLDWEVKILEKNLEILEDY